ncbi:amino acid adenylation enzyme/thioester reductase family protein [Desulfosporosinus orientis DSM 765]|uniref:Amino acid adenylation enzyme/thioester reductase family protein n=1 Tax=Desulfosporosinus orientis (strain ATCC 19365 / DSM 765 / NCIMB 8382 / VKM B-1628 / Singapore I) TaxID=768706 RepID=G7W6S0_DESOD|nr:non-ribosomal peptide synthetase [Desulfosporosinus orientis]AET69202.1 amino acid adenylation enzyme/thioester reductase family protein [Desulfosporosinus orientis DSM 765]
MEEQKVVYPLTNAQIRIWETEQFFKGTSIANIGGALYLKEETDFAVWEQCINKLIERNDSLRIRIVETNSGPKQWIEPYRYQRIEQVDFTGKLRKEQETWLTNRLQIPFEVYAEPLYTFISIKAWDGYSGVFLKIHHMLGDGWTIGLLSTQIMAEYARRTGKANDPDSLEYSYLDFIKSEQEYLHSGKYEKDREYWLEKFKLKPELMAVKPKNSLYYSAEAKRLTYAIEAEEAGMIRDYCKAYSTSPAILFEAALGIYLQRLHDLKRISFGVPVLNRRGVKELSTVGMYVSTIPIQIELDEKVSFADLCKQLGKEHFQCFRHQRYPYNRMLAEVRELHGIHDNLYDVSVSYQNAKIDKTKYSYDFKTVWYFNGYQTESLCLHIDDRDDAGVFVLHIDYLRELFQTDEIDDIYRRIMLILWQAISDGSQRITDLELVDGRERQKLLKEFNQTKADYPRDKTIHQLFEEQAVRTPDQTAAVFEGESLTYEELNSRANCLARLLREKGVGRDKIVGLMPERSLEMLVGIMAILKAGGAYLPIAPETPGERIGYMLEDANAVLLITHEHLMNRVSSQWEVLDLSSEFIAGEKSFNLENVNLPRDLAYVMYTSGSTGKPKGVMIEHRSVLNLCAWIKDFYKLEENKNILSTTRISFDVSVEELLGGLLSGGTVFIGSKGLMLEPEKLITFIQENKINIAQFVPATLHSLLRVKKITSLRVVVCGSEKLNDGLKDKILGMGYELFDGYGPTEATVEVTIARCEPGKSTIGKPIANNSIYILSGGRGIQPVGAAGEICISGIGLARGYLNRPELTAEKFMANPFLPGERLYRTGDLGRWLPDGEIEFIGRIDHQVKIRGYRIELGEIEALLVKYEGIKEAAVTAREDETGSKYLCAYFVSYLEVTATELREHLAQRLPDYMLPSFFIPLPKLPLNPNGKIDRQRLPEPEGSIQTGADYVPPSTETEIRLARLWEEVLGFEKIGVNDSFFELGGHSLKAAILASKIGKEFKVEFPLREIFTAATIREEADYIDKAAESWARDLAAAEKRDFYPASPAQRGLYLLNHMDKNSTSYNMPGAMKIEGNLDEVKLKRVFKKLVQRHEAFRTSFHLRGAEVVQKIEDHLEFTVEAEELEEGDLSQVMTGFVRPFDLSQAPLLRVQLLKVIREEPGILSPPAMYYLLLIDLHHIISDGTSLAVLVRDFISFYKGEELPELSLQYKDFAVWQNKQLDSQKVRKQKEYWLNSFQGRIPVLELPADYPRPAFQNFAGDVVEFTVNKELTAGLKKLAAEKSATLYMLLLAAYNLLLYKYTGQEDIVVGSPIAGRQHPDLGGIIGMFVNTLALRNYPEGRKSFAEFLEEVKERALLAYENQDVQYKDLVEELGLKIDLSRNPLFDTMFIFQNMDSCEPEIEGLRFTGQSMGLRTAKFDLTLTGEEVGEEIHFELEYCTKLFKQETMLRFVRHFTNILKAVTENPELRLADLDILAEEERGQLLWEFNQTKVDYAKDKLIHQLFEDQAEKTPENIALVFAERTITYGELNSRANGVAQVLRGKGVGPESIVSLMTEPSVEMIVGIIAILKAGGAYLPIDPEYPEERIGYMLADSQAKVLLTQRSLQGLLERITYPGEVIDLSSPELVLGSREAKNLGNLENLSSPEDLAYVIYTSGSTGRPKGVLVEQRNLLAYVMTFNQEFELTGEDAVLQQASCCFDAFGEEIYPVLLKGGRLVLARRAEVRDVNLLAGVINRNSISLISCSPLLLNQLNTLTGLRSVHTFISGGDVLKGDYIDNLLQRGAQVYNTYGPTEATVCASYHRCLPGEKGLVPVGKPIANYRIYILDPDNNLSPLNIAGELCIAGEGVSRGYLNRPELTAERFVENPFVPGERMYRTGDLARWLPDGSIEFLGRIDQQVKIRGFRIELGEIEAPLLRLAGVKEAVVLAREDNSGGKYLCAYLIGEGEIGVPELRKHLAQELPDYMIPSYFLQLEKLPLTPSGKIDRQALPEPKESINTEAGYVPASTETEIRLARLWQEVLEVERIGVHDNFFELGGHSLKATLLVLKVQEEFGLTIPLVTMFSEGTIALLAGYIDAVRASVKPVVKADVKSDVKPAVKPDLSLVSDPKLVLLKAVDGVRENLFLIHDGSCTVEGYVEFSRRLEVEANVWGIKGAEAENMILPGITIADLAADYLKTIKKVQPEGPYSLAGWSSGGGIAFEMALQLESAGERIRFVSMIDSPPPGNADSGSELKGFMEMWEKLEGQLKEDLEGQTEEPFEKLPEGVAQAGARAGNGIPENGIPGAVFKLMSDYRTLNYQDRARRLKVVKAVLAAEISYQPAAKLQAELVYIGASESKVIPNQPWSGDCEKPVRYVEVKGDHFSIFKSPDVIGLTTAFAWNFQP